MVEMIVARDKKQALMFPVALRREGKVRKLRAEKPRGR